MNKKHVAIPLYIWFFALAGAVLRGIYSYFSFYDPEEYSYILAVKTNDIERFIGMIKEFQTGCLDLVFLKFIYGISSNELFVRFSYVVLGVVFILLVYRLVLEMSGSLFVSAAVTAIVAFSPIHIFYAQIVRYHNFVCIFSALSIYSFFILLTSKPGWKFYVIYGLSTALAMMSHYYVLYLIAAQGAAFLFMGARSVEMWKVYVKSQISALVFFLPWLPIFIYHMNVRLDTCGMSARSVINQFRGTGVLNIADALVGYFLSDTWLFHDDFILYKLILLGVLLVLIVAGVFAVSRCFKEKGVLATYLTVILIVTTVLPFATRESTGMAFSTKFLLPFSIVFYMLVAYGLEKAPAWVRNAALVTLVFVFSGSFYILIAAAAEKPTIKSIVPELVKQVDNNTALATTIYVCGENIRDYAGAAGEDLDVIVVTRIPPGRAGYMLNEPATHDDMVRFLSAVEGYEDLWLFYCVLKIEDNAEGTPERDDAEGENIFRGISSVMDLKETVQFKISPRKNYFVGRAYKFQRKP